MLGHAVLDALLPAVCPGCHNQLSRTLCLECQATLERIEIPCLGCGAACDQYHYCHVCHNRGIPSIRSCHVDYVYSGIVRDLIIQAKVKAQRSALYSLCELMPIQKVQALPVDAVCVIPPSPGRRYGPHLASTVAKFVAKRIEKPIVFGLKQTRLPAAQHELPAHMRKRNTEDLFIWKHHAPAAKRVLLIDDLITSGHTISAAARCLRKAGAQQIFGAAIARTGFNSELKKRDTDLELG